MYLVAQSINHYQLISYRSTAFLSINQLLWKAVEDRPKLDFQDLLIFSSYTRPLYVSIAPDIHKIGSETKMDWDTLCFNVATLIAGVFVLDYGADKFIDHTVIVGRRLGISQTVIALLTAGAEWEEVCNSCNPIQCLSWLIPSLARCGGCRHPAASHPPGPWERHGLDYL